MRSLLVLFFFFGLVTWAYAQDSTKIEPPKIVARLKVGNTVDFGSKRIKFIKVTEDSRCPKGVECIWPGEAKAIIGIYTQDTLIEEKEFIFGAQAINENQIEKIIPIDKKTLYSYGLSPYPSSEKPIDPSSYYLELIIKQNN
ncbi:hypothetical protein U6A24_17615 [Aquimarina gracilis]|uniref:Uncharacterized protein n=1 Tax=Aquimarina gracilis TaxID=874422 RepID=A0ABU5ZZK5_9FLAO|nr:hypothetical protein [Aquimarina gracilis]MEB3347297.1 hypothetical protein [Aquimarina gracilis]